MEVRRPICTHSSPARPEGSFGSHRQSTACVQLAYSPKMEKVVLSLQAHVKGAGAVLPGTRRAPSQRSCFIEAPRLKIKSFSARVCTEARLPPSDRHVASAAIQVAGAKPLVSEYMYSNSFPLGARRAPARRERKEKKGKKERRKKGNKG